MNPMRRAAMLKLATSAYEMGLEVFNGTLQQGADGGWTVRGRDMAEWLATHAGEEVVVVLGSMADDRPVETRTCRTCGRDYTEAQCPYCRANRLRLRGRP